MAEDLHVSIPAKVVRVELAKGLVDAQPLVKDVFDGQAVSVPVIPNVPVVWPGAGGYRLTFPIAAGDIVLLVFSDRSLDLWLEKGGEVDPEDPRRHALSDAIAIPGLRSFREPWTGAAEDAAVLGKDGAPQVKASSDAVTIGREGSPVVKVTGDAVMIGQPGLSGIKVTLSGVSLGKDDALVQPVALGTSVRTELDAIWAALQTHIHAGVTSGSQVSGTAAVTRIAETVESDAFMVPVPE